MKIKIFAKKILKKIKSLLPYKKNYCPFCKQNSVFLPFGIIPRKRALCPVCNSLERHRLLYSVYNILFLSDKKKIKLLHTAPEKCIYDLLSPLDNIDYNVIDISPEKYPFAKNILKQDVTNLQFEDKSFDIILSNHVMEHIENEQKFLQELLRVLKDDGTIILTTLYRSDMEKTFENSSIKSPEERLKNYGQEDHVRLYGKDLYQRLSAFFDVRLLKEEDISPPAFSKNHLKN